MRTCGTILMVILVSLGSFDESRAGAPLRATPVGTTASGADSTKGGEAERGTWMKEGAIAGGMIGGFGGGIYAVLIAAIIDSEEGDVTTAGYVAIGFLGAALGGTGGALLGGLIGSAFPRGSGRDGSPSAADTANAGDARVPADRSSPEPSHGPGRTGALVLQPIGVTGDFPGGGGLQLALLSRTSSATCLGIEGTITNTEPRIRALGGVGRLYPLRGAGLYLVGGIGLYEFHHAVNPVTYSTGTATRTVNQPWSVEFLGGGAGVGFESKGERLRIGAEWRVHGKIQRIQETGPLGFRQIGVTVRYLW